MSPETPSTHRPRPSWQGLYSLASWLGLLLLVAVLLALVAKVVDYNASVGARARSRIQLLATMEALTTGESPPRTSRSHGAPPPVQLPPACAACHRVAGTSASGIAGPDLTTIGQVAEERIRSPDYRGQAATGAEYIRESILQPSAYVAPGHRQADEAGISLMPAAVGESLRGDELERLVESLAALR